jgi:hypothetical protein
MEMSGQDKVVAGVAVRPPDSRVVRAQDADVTVHGWRTVRAGHGDDAALVGNKRRAVVNPVTAASHDGFADARQANAIVVIARDGEHRRDRVEPPDQRAELVEFGATIDQVTAEQHGLRSTSDRGLQDLIEQEIGSTVAKMDVADVQQTAGIGCTRQSLLPDVQRVMKADFEQSRGLAGHKELYIIK